MACKTCKKKSKKKGAKVGEISMDKIPTNQLLYGVVGAIVAKVIDKPLQSIPVAAFQQNALLRDAVKLVGGVLLTTMNNEMAVGAGTGMAIYAGTKIVGSFLPANLNDAVAGIYGSGRYQNGTGPVNVNGLPQGGFQSLSAMSGTGGYQGGLGTNPDVIIADKGGLNIEI